MATSPENHLGIADIQHEVAVVARRNRDEAGLSKYGVMAALGVASLAAGLLANMNGLVEHERTLEVSGLEVGLTGQTAVARQEFLTFTAVASANAKYTKQDSIGPISAPASIFEQRMESMPFGAEVLNEATDLSWEVKKDGKVHVSLDDETAFQVKVYPIYEPDSGDPGHPFNNYFNEHNNWASSIGGVLESALKAAPLPEGITPTEMEDMAASLQVSAVVAGTEAIAEACGPVALKAATPEVKKKIEETVRSYLEMSADAFKVSKDAVDNTEIVVDDFPTDPSFSSQYLGATKKLNEGEGLGGGEKLEVTMPNIDAATCKEVEATS